MFALPDNFTARLAAVGLDRRLPVVATVVMVLLLAQSLAVMTWRLLPQPEVKGVSVLATPRLVQSGARQQDNITQISQWHLFGETQKLAPTPAANITEAPDTHLNLKLRGVIATGDPTSARAIIADGRGVENSYAIGKSLPGNAVLREIYADRVILEYRGRLETLRLPKEDSNLIQTTQVGSSNRALSQSHRPGYFPRVIPNHTVRNAGTSALLRQYREDLINNPQNLMNLVTVAPVTDAGTGKLKGYRIHPGKDKALLGKFGLRNGDVVTSVNGVSLDNPIKALEIMRDLSSASSVSLDIERNGVMQSLSFEVD
jgi:general secretion pathway protein C